jgi:hypothetical protein
MALTDLQTQFEALIDAVWVAEANWRLDDRIDLAVGLLPTRRTDPIERSGGTRPPPGNLQGPPWRPGEPK